MDEPDRPVFVGPFPVKMATLWDFMRAHWAHSRFSRSTPGTTNEANRAAAAAKARVAYLDRLRQTEAAETSPERAALLRWRRINNLQILIGLQSIFDREQARTSFVELEALQEAVTRSDVNEQLRVFLAEKSDLVKELRAKTDSLRRDLNDLE